MNRSRFKNVQTCFELPSSFFAALCDFIIHFIFISTAQFFRTIIQKLSQTRVTTVIAYDKRNPLVGRNASITMIKRRFDNIHSESIRFTTPAFICHGISRESTLIDIDDGNLGRGQERPTFGLRPG